MNDLTLRIIFGAIFILSVLISSVSQVMLKTSANKTYASRIKEYLNPTVIIAYILFFMSTLITVFAHKIVPLSLGPILESTGYVFVSIFSYFLLKERIGKRKLIGILLIIGGVIFYSIQF